RRFSSASLSASRTLRTPLSLAAASAAGFAPLPATSTSTSPPIWAAAVSALAVWSERVALSCSAIRRIAICLVPSDFLDDAVGFQLLNQLCNRADLDASLAAARLFRLQNLQTRRNVGAEIGRRLFVERLLLGLHDIRQRCIARLVQAKIDRDDRRKLHIDGLETA